MKFVGCAMDFKVNYTCCNIGTAENVGVSATCKNYYNNMQIETST